MGTQITMTKISAHKKGQSARDGVAMYTFTGKGVSQTKHMTEREANAHKKSLEG
jgi:hypothetical protein